LKKKHKNKNTTKRGPFNGSSLELHNKGKIIHLWHLGCSVINLHHYKQREIFLHDLDIQRCEHGHLSCFHILVDLISLCLQGLNKFWNYKCLFNEWLKYCTCSTQKSQSLAMKVKSPKDWNCQICVMNNTMKIQWKWCPKILNFCIIWIFPPWNTFILSTPKHNNFLNNSLFNTPFSS
jgi:hypothetical protein